ncbi:hypothetical protein Droror1_Dr00011886, partial [Drosera rotundifolia]
VSASITDCGAEIMVSWLLGKSLVWRIRLGAGAGSVFGSWPGLDGGYGVVSVAAGLSSVIPQSLRQEAELCWDA